DSHVHHRPLHQATPRQRSGSGRESWSGCGHQMGSAESRAEDSDARSSEPRPVLTGERLAPPNRASTLADDPQLLDLLAEDSRLNVYAGELEVRPPGAPTIGAGPHGAEPLVQSCALARVSPLLT